MLNNPRINFFFGKEFLCSSGSSDNSQVLLDGVRFDVGPHAALFDLDYIKRVTKQTTIEKALAAFISKKEFFDRNCNYLFSSAEYAQAHGVISGLHPIMHYLLIGDRFGARIGSRFWTDWVKARYPDDPRPALQIHMENQKWVAPNPYFDPVWYLNAHVDVFRSGLGPYQHYLEHGIGEGRSPHKLIDWAWYTAVTGQEKPTLDEYLAKRWRTGVFPHPRARSGWAYLPDRELEKLFESNLSPIVGVASARTNSSHELVTSTPHDLLQSISYTFPIQESENLVAEFASRYAADPGARSVRVSVVVPTKNRLLKLRHAVESVLAQTHENIELLIVDDGSDDDTAGWVRTLADNRIRLFECSPRGVSAARNTGIENATGEYIAFLDSDNVMLPHFIASMLVFCRSNNVDFAYAGLRLYNDAGDVRYRFKAYDPSTYWKANCIDMNVIFHKRDAFAEVRFDEGLRRCVDWDYILHLCRIREPVSVPILGCDYYHDGAGIDRITLSGPVWDCSRVSQRHRPKITRSSRATDVFVIPLAHDTVAVAISLLSREMLFLPSGVKVQCVATASTPQKMLGALSALLTTAGHPDPLLCHMPYDVGTLVDYAFGMCTVEADRWHVATLHEDVSLLALLNQAASAYGTLILPHRDDSGMYLALVHEPTTGRWSRIWSDADEVQSAAVPLEFDLLNLSSAHARALDLRCGGFLALPLLALRYQEPGEWHIGLGRRKAAKEAQAIPYGDGLSLLNALNEYVPGTTAPGDRQQLRTISLRYGVANSRLETIPVRSRARSGPKMAIFTSAPHRGSGWGDEFYAESLAREMATLGTPTDVVYRGNWSDSGNEYSHVLHVRGIVAPVLKENSKNLMWIISHPDKVWSEEVSRCEHVYTASRLHAEELATTYGDKITFLPQCTAFEPSPEIRSLASGPLERYAVFVGDSKNVLRYPIDDLVKNWKRFFLIGPHWKDAAGMGARYRPQGVRNEYLPKIYRNFGAVLNQHWPDMARLGFISNRLYDVAASGGYFISDECQEMPEELLAFGVVWRGGGIEDLFSGKPSVSGTERYERSLAFYERNSFRARAMVIRDFVLQG